MASSVLLLLLLVCVLFLVLHAGRDQGSGSGSGSDRIVRPPAGHGQRIYISLTTIAQRLDLTYVTIRSLIRGNLLPDAIYLFLSREPFLLDEGVDADGKHRRSLDRIERLKAEFQNLHVVFVSNTGPRRKLLPLLREKWQEDCLIVTVDDDTIYHRNMLASLINYYLHSGGQAIVALRVRRIGFCVTARAAADGQDMDLHYAPYMHRGRGAWPFVGAGMRELFLLPIGFGGVLYRPAFFSAFVFDEALGNLTRTADDLLFRLATLANRIEV